MARPQKNSADYFSHDANASQNEKLVYLESLFGECGYCWYFKMLEALTSSDYYEIEWSDVKCAIYSRRFNADLDKFKAFIVAATTPEIAAFRIENGKLFSPGLKKRLSVVDEKRQKDAERLATKRNQMTEIVQNTVVAATTPEIAATNTQSKVKESKVKESNTVVVVDAHEKNFERLDASAVSDGFLTDTLIQEAFSMSRKIPQRFFADYLRMFQSDIKARDEPYYARPHLVSHFLNFSSRKYEAETKAKHQPGRASPGRTQYNQPAPFTTEKQAF